MSRKNRERHRHRTRKILQQGGIPHWQKALLGLLALSSVPAVDSRFNKSLVVPSNFRSPLPSGVVGPYGTFNSSGAVVRLNGPSLFPRASMNESILPSNKDHALSPIPSPLPEGFVNVTMAQIAEVSKAPELKPTLSPQPGPAPTIAGAVEPLSQIVLKAQKEYLQGVANITRTDIVTVVQGTTLRDSFIIGGHNTVTTTSRMIPFTATPLAQANQRLTLETYLESCTTTGKCLLDIDMWASPGGITSKHGGPTKGYFINASPETNTAQLLQKIHTFAASHPDVTFIIRTENHGVGAEEIEGMWKGSMRDQVVGISKQDNPTHGEIQAQGKNILYFLEDTRDISVDPVTGRVTGSLLHAQDNFFVRTKWDQVDKLLGADELTPDLVLMDTAKLGPYPMIMVDGYVTAVGANIKGLDAQTQLIANINTVLLPKIKTAMANAGLNANVSGAMIMADYVNSDMFSYQVAVDMYREIPDQVARDYVLRRLPSVFVEAQREANADIVQGFLDKYYRVLGKGRGSTSEKAHVGTTCAVAGALGLYILSYFLAKLNLKGIVRNVGKGIAKFLRRKKQQMPELKDLIQEGYQMGIVSEKGVGPTEAFNNDPRERDVSPPSRGSNSASEPRPPASPEEWTRFSKSQKRKEIERQRRAFHSTVFNGGRTRKLKR